MHGSPAGSSPLLIGTHRSLQTGSVSEADYEALVLKLHEIEVGCSGAVDKRRLDLLASVSLLALLPAFSRSASGVCGIKIKTCKPLANGYPMMCLLGPQPQAHPN